MRKSLLILAFLLSVTVFAQEVDHKEPEKGDAIIALHMEAQTKMDVLNDIIKGLNYLDIVIARADTLTWTVTTREVFETRPGDAALSFCELIFRIVEEDDGLVVKCMAWTTDEIQLGKRITVGAYGFGSIKISASAYNHLQIATLGIPNVKERTYRRGAFFIY